MCPKTTADSADGNPNALPFIKTVPPASFLSFLSSFLSSASLLPPFTLSLLFLFLSFHQLPPLLSIHYFLPTFLPFLFIFSSLFSFSFISFHHQFPSFCPSSLPSSDPSAISSLPFPSLLPSFLFSSFLPFPFPFLSFIHRLPSSPPGIRGRSGLCAPSEVWRPRSRGCCLLEACPMIPGRPHPPPPQPQPQPGH